MNIEQERKYDYLSPEAYSRYQTGNAKIQRAKFEEKAVFRKDLSVYDMETQQVTPGDVCRYDQINCSGVPLDYDSINRRIYMDGSDAHTLLIGATGSKKSRLVVMPTIRTLVASREGMVICDPKGEIYRRTASYLMNSGYRVHAINLREPAVGDGWNVLQIPYEHYLKGQVDKACELINDMTLTLMPVTSKDPYWDYSSRDMLFGLVLLLFQIAKEHKLPVDEVTMKSILKLREELFLSADSHQIMASDLWEYAKQHDLIRARLNGIVICPDRTLSCIISTFDQHMSCFSLQPQLVDLLSSSTFDVADLGFEPVAIYLIMPDEKTTYHKIITVFIKQIYEFLIDSAFKNTQENRFDKRINFILDEFSSLPMIADFPQMISASRSRNIRFVLVVQSKHQLRQRYENETETIMSNCSNWLFLTSREVPLLREISELGGYKKDNRDPLIGVSWLQHLSKEEGECLVFNGRKQPYLAHLADIDNYDSQNNVVCPMRMRSKVALRNSYNRVGYFSTLVTRKERKDETSELQAELEKRFDELFGSLADSGE